MGVKPDIILGGGLAGLIWACTHPDSILIEPNSLGGMAAHDMGPFIVHESPWVGKFLLSIEIEPKTREFTVGYMDWADAEIHSSAPGFFREKYYRNTRYANLDDEKVPASVMNSDMNRFTGYDISQKDFVRACIEKAYDNGTVFLEDKITRIKPNNAFFGPCFQTESDKFYVKTSGKRIISTIPKPIFDSLAGIKRDYALGETSLGKGIWRLKSTTIDEYDLKKIGKYDFVYCTSEWDGETYFPTRLMVKPGYILAEYTFPGHMNREELKNTMLNNTLDDETEKIGEPIIMPNAAIRRSMPTDRWGGIEMLGRAAAWDHSIKINDVIKYAIQSNER